MLSTKALQDSGLNQGHSNRNLRTPFHRQAKGMPVAKNLSRAWQVPMIFYFYFVGIVTLDKSFATSSLAAYR